MYINRLIKKLISHLLSSFNSLELNNQVTLGEGTASNVHDIIALCPTETLLFLTSCKVGGAGKVYQ